MANKSLVALAVVTAFYSLASAVTGIFLPNYYLQVGLSIDQIILLMGTVFLVLGLLPLLTLKLFPKIFEKLLILGIFLYIVFFIFLAFVKIPIVLGLTLGLSYATFWPAFNLLIFRLTNIKRRSLVVSLLYVAIPTVTSIIGPALGGILIHFFTFNILFLVAIVCMVVALAFSFRIKYQPVGGGLSIPKGGLLLLFAMIIVVMGFADPTYIPYPLFLNQLTGNFLYMGIVASAILLVFGVISLIGGKLASVEKHRIDFVIIGMLAQSIWIIALYFVQNVPELVGVSVFYGVSGAFGILLFAVYGDFFKRKQHAVLVVLWEVFLMVGRLANLIPVYTYINNFDFKSYFIVVGLISLSAMVLLALLRRMHIRGKVVVDRAQR